jgi:hypothetical protein
MAALSDCIEQSDSSNNQAWAQLIAQREYLAAMP